MTDTVMAGGRPLASYIDHTILKPEARKADVRDQADRDEQETRSERSVVVQQQELGGQR